MPAHERRSAREERPKSTLFGILVVATAVIAVIATVVFFTTRPGQSNNAATGNAPVETNASANKTSATNKNATSAKDGNATKDENGTTKADGAKLGNSYSNETSGTNATDATNKESGQSSSGSGSSTAGESASGSSSSTGSSASNAGTTSSTSESASATSGTEGSSASSTYGSSTSSPTYTTGSGWIEAEGCASCVAESGTLTASEIPFDDSVPQVGLDVASYPYSHFGNYVEISYGGITVTAQVVDCGSYNAGDSGIMINPAVFEDFGVSSVYDWGRRMVSYRFV